MKQLVKRYKGYDIYFDDDKEMTVPNSHWIVSKEEETAIYWLPGNYSLSEIEKFIDNMFVDVI